MTATSMCWVPRATPRPAAGPSPPPAAALGGVGSALAIGVLAGLYPGVRAARLPHGGPGRAVTATINRQSRTSHFWFAVRVPDIEATVSRVLVQAGQKLYGIVKRQRQRRRLYEETRPLTPARVVEGLRAELDDAQLLRVDGYVKSPDFEEIALQYVLGKTLDDVPSDDLRVNIRHEIRHGLRRAAGLDSALLTTAADVVYDALVAGYRHVAERPTTSTIATAAHLTAAAAANSELLRDIDDLARVHEFAQQLRAQVVAVHGHMRLPHLGVSLSVPYEQLYVEPEVRPLELPRGAPSLEALPLPGQRSVILGDPGAGKSTFAAKLAHDVAADRVPDAEGRVPFLLVLREFTGSFLEGGKALTHYLEQVCRAPYNLEPPPSAVEYLLRNGRALVLLDGLDELVEPELRRKVVQLVDGFVNLFPLVPVVVTARRIGYAEAPLDRRRFRVGVLGDLTERQVKQYATRWFALDESTSAADRDRTVEQFMAESGGITELRANPLLLALLCAMYSSEHYIPVNLAQVYERCAVMLFDRWDLMRGIGKAPQFIGRLRGAVQHLAWQMFHGTESGKPLPRHRIIRLLIDHLVSKKFDEDNAAASAEEFVEFCTGRAWILSDVGATTSEPLYGFTHRTFMEYFAAEHLVRTHPTPQRLWAVLRPRIIAGEWEVVAQVALQQLDRNVDGGVDELLRLVLAERPERVQLREFAARTLGYVHPGRDVIHDVTVAAVRSTLAAEPAERFHYWSGFDVFETMRARDDALHTLMYASSPGNLPAIRQTVTAVMDEQLAQESEAAKFAVLHLDRHLTVADERRVRVWRDTKDELRDRHREAITAWRLNTPWADLLTSAEPAQLVTRFGVGPLYLADAVLTGSLPSTVERILTSRTPIGDGDALCTALLAAPRPWISDDRWWDISNWGPEDQGFRRILTDAQWRGVPILPRVLLFLPYLETRVEVQNEIPLPPNVPILHQLATARSQGSIHSDLLGSLRRERFTSQSRSFLLSWARSEIDTVHRSAAG